MQIKDLNKKQLGALRKEITLNSLFLKDYSNSFGIDEQECFTFFDSYVETLYMYSHDKNADFFEIAEKYDNIENLYGFWCEVYGGY